MCASVFCSVSSDIPQKIIEGMMASKFRLLVVAVLAASASAATHDGPVGFIMQMGLPDGSKTEAGPLWIL